MKTGVPTNIIIDTKKQRKIKNIEPLSSNCRTCLYYDGKLCKFNKNIKGRKYCIKYSYSSPSLIKKQKKKKVNDSKLKKERVIKKTSYERLSKFLGVPITYEVLQDRYRSYSKGYSLKKQSEEPLIIVLREERTRSKSYYEIIK